MKSLGARFAATVGGIGIAVLVVLILLSSSESRRHMREQVGQQLALALEFDLAIRSYVSNTLRSELSEQCPDVPFVPELMSSSFVARSVFESVRRRFPTLILRFASDDPRNPVNRASPAELDLIHYFAENPDAERWMGEIDFDGKRHLGYFHPRRMEPSCLRCHGDQNDAPPELVDRYGDTAGFGRVVGAVVALDTVAAPLDALDAIVEADRTTQLLYLAGGAALLILAVLVTFRSLVSTRLTRLRDAFRRLSGRKPGEAFTPLPEDGRDEVAELGREFNALAAELQRSQEHLEEQVSSRTHELQEANRELEHQISERERTEEQLRQSQKMEAIGLLAGGVAHDFNNLLTTITGYCELLLEDLPDRTAQQEDVREILDAAHRASALTGQLLAFSRKEPARVEELDLDHTLAGMEKMLRRLLGEHIEFATELGAGDACVVTDPGQLEQVLLNLAVNARDAMPTGGRLTMATDSVEFKRSHRGLGLPAGRYVALSVRDTGTGMDAETRERAFEPFFTTKPSGRGTGLGLSTVYGIVTQSGGTIRLDSTPGEGTRFDIFLPQSGGEAPEGMQTQAEPELPGGSETILVAEDENAVGTLIRRILEARGYKVLLACNAGEALLLSEKHDGRIDLLLSDVIMPRMSGPELVERLAPTRPDMKFMYVSGYTAEALDSYEGVSRDSILLDKPFTPEQLLSAVRDVLDREISPPLG